MIAHFQISSLSNLSEGILGGELRREFKTEAVFTLVLLIHAAIFLAGITTPIIILIIPIIIISSSSKNSRSWKLPWELASFCLAQLWEIIFYFSFLSRNTRLLVSYSRSFRKKWIFIKLSRKEERTFFLFFRFVVVENISPGTTKQSYSQKIWWELFWALILVLVSKPEIE